MKSKSLSQKLAAMLFSAACLLPAASHAQDGPQMNLQRVKISAGMHQIDAQVALTPEQRQIGLMFRKDMPQSEGMIFVFEQPAQQMLLDEKHPAATYRRICGG
jgi:hypothetical protein